MSEGWKIPRYIRSRTMDSSSRAGEHGGNTEMRQQGGTSEGRGLGDIVPSSPPPSYEHVLEETRLEAEQAESARTPDDETTGNSKRQEAAETTTTTTVAKRPEILHKSSKELYRAVAAQWGITCKMSDHCRCLDCQSKYFDCEYDQNEQEKTDGGLGAGTPMFIEVMHGTACSIL